VIREISPSFVPFFYPVCSSSSFHVFPAIDKGSSVKLPINFCVPSPFSGLFSQHFLCSKLLSANDMVLAPFRHRLRQSRLPTLVAFPPDHFLPSVHASFIRLSIPSSRALPFELILPLFLLLPSRDPKRNTAQNPTKPASLQILLLNHSPHAASRAAFPQQLRLHEIQIVTFCTVVRY